MREQVYSLLFFVRHHLQYFPAICLMATGIAFISHIHKCWLFMVKDIPVNEYAYSEAYLTIYTLADHYFSCTLPTLVLLTSMSFYECWGRKAAYPLIYLWAMWVIVHIDIVAEPAKDIYFYSFLSLFYITFVYLTVKSLINRNVK